jgi:hypothetical protein
MPDSPRTIIGQFSSVGGQPQVRAANARAVEPAADLPEHSRGKLYMLVDITDPEGGTAALYRQMLNAAQAAYYDAEGSPASALTRAVRAAHAVLVRTNEALVDAYWRAAMTLAALDGWNLNIAQAGPSLCLVSHPKTIEQFPGDTSAWTKAFGGPERPEVKLFETRVEPGSVVLLAGSAWLLQVTPERLAVATTAQNVRDATDYLAQLAGDAQLSALAVIVHEPDPAAAPVTTSDDLAPTTAALAAMTVATAAKEPRAGRRLFGTRARPAAAPKPEIEAEPTASEPSPAPMPVAVAEPEPEPEAKALPLAEEEGLPREHRRSPWPLVLALVIIPLVVGGLVLSMWWLRARDAEAQFVQTLDGASAAVTDAATLSDETAARLQLTRAGELLDAAKVSRPDDPRLDVVEARYQEQLERINKVTPLYGTVPLWEFKGDGRNLSRVLVSGDSLFVLDRGLNEAYRFVLSQLKDSVTPMEGDKPILKKGEQVGDAVVGDLLDMTWVEATGNQRSKLLALDTAKNLFSYDVTWGPAKALLASAAKLSAPQLLNGYNGNLYVADPGASQIWRYRPSANGYENEAEPYFPADKTVGLTGAASMAIDGSVWMVFTDGRLLKFMGGEQQAFELQGLPDPLRGPIAIAAPLEADALYVADAGNSRIVEFNKNGEFQRQFWAREGDALKDMRSIHFDPASGALFILTGDKLWKAPIPEKAAEETS